MPAIRNRATKRCAAQRRPTPHFGSRIANICLGNSDRLFTVHSDLICKSSQFFRKKLQGNRKDIEGDCPICYDDFGNSALDLTYCTTCGGNFHEECMEQWFRQSRIRNCPLCRSIWGSQHNAQIFRFVNIRPEDFEIYRAWLYMGRVSCYEAIERDDFKPMIQAYLFALHIEDVKFSTAILHAMLDWYEHNSTYPDQGAVALAYEEHAIDDMGGIHRLHRFLVNSYVMVARASWFEEEDWRAYPHEFFRDLTVAMFSKHPGKNNWRIDNWKAELDAEEEALMDQ